MFTDNLEIEVFWTPEDAMYVAKCQNSVMNLSGLGDTRGKALNELGIAIDMAMDILEKDNENR